MGSMPQGTVLLYHNPRKNAREIFGNGWGTASLKRQKFMDHAGRFAVPPGNGVSEKPREITRQE